jgi:acetoin utilization deacetylase AcuC-like enzyme
MLKIAYSPIYKYELPEGHRFPMLKYEMIPEQLLYEGAIHEDSFFHPNPLADAIIEQTHTPQYWHRLKHQKLTDKEIRRIGFPMTPRLVERCIIIADGTIQCALFAQKYGISLNVAGGTHHAFTGHGEAFCLLNDVAIASNYLINNKLCKRILIIDLDVHQGNGTAEIFNQSPNKWQNTVTPLRDEAENIKGGVFTFSMHGQNNYPVQKQKSDLDIGLPDGIEDKPYLTILTENLDKLFDAVKPDFAFFNAGVDVIKGDKLGRLGLTIEGCNQRDKIVFDLCKKNNVPVAVVMGGGYSSRFATVVEAHANTFKMAQHIFF